METGAAARCAAVSAVRPWCRLNGAASVRLVVAPASSFALENQSRSLTLTPRIPSVVGHRKSLWSLPRRAAAHGESPVVVRRASRCRVEDERGGRQLAELRRAGSDFDERDRRAAVVAVVAVCVVVAAPRTALSAVPRARRALVKRHVGALDEQADDGDRDERGVRARVAVGRARGHMSDSPGGEHARVDRVERDAASARRAPSQRVEKRRRAEQRAEVDRPAQQVVRVDRGRHARPRRDATAV
mmetsp:Transcript_27234/g.109050  ORF Transcript_27234/g.109050 Transcript_27234/m.109050 type:complete len:244 (-) Transcript_27234:358-1089(-)